MTSLDGNQRIVPAELERAIHVADPAVLFIEPRILRRVIKQDRRLTAIGFQVPHAHVYTIERERLLVIADRPELNLSPAAELPPQVILLPRPQDDDRVVEYTTAEALHWYWRQLFHARVHIELEQQLNDRLLDEDAIAARVRELGAVEFAEVRHVLVKDDLLAPTHSIVDAYLEFLAVALELRYFEASDRPLYFPAIQDWEAVDAATSLAVRHAALYRQTRPEGAPESIEHVEEPFEAELERMMGESPAGETTASPQRCQRLLAQAERARRVGNNVKGAMLRMRAARLSDQERVRPTLEGAGDELQRLVDRLRAMWGLSVEESADWVMALAPLLRSAAIGFRSVEARLLYDLQKACIAHERGFFRFGIVSWVLSGGKEPLRRPLPTLQRVLEAKRLRSAARRVPTVRMTVQERKRLELLLADAVERVEARLREEIRPRINAVLDDAGLVPENVPERLARGKLVEELLDRVAERGFLNMGDFRDGLSQNDLKLPDVAGPAELLRGDKLLRADRQLGSVLDGVYRSGAIYLRWPQRLSSLAFGTRRGRFLTQYIVLPFGGAFVALEAIKHVAHLMTGSRHVAPGPADAAAAAPEPASQFDPVFFVWVFFVGMMLMLILHRPKFRAWLGRLLGKSWKVLKRVVIDVPAEILRAAWVQRILQSQAYLVVRNYALRPAILTAICAGLSRFWGPPWSRDFLVQFFLGADLLLNTPVGRYADEWLADVLVRAWHELRIRVLAAAFQWVMDVFHQLLEWLERVIYTVDEWLRFRAGDARGFVAVKFILSLVWSVLAYVVRIFVTLLIEPQINPIKHFPVVTVTHKVMLPYLPALARHLELFLGKFEASTVATAIILLLPGVFGFLVWELKENWRLYAANRPRALAPMRVGRNGETVTALLRPGIHSGTMTKLFTRVRRALSGGETSVHSQAARKHLAAIQVVEVAVRRFVDRTLCRLLSETGFRGGAPIRTEGVRLATNRIEVQLGFPEETARHPLCLRLDDFAGWLNATIQDPGWLADIDPEERSRFNAALAGFYKRAGVDLVREQLADSFGTAVNRAELTRDNLVLAGASGTAPSVTYRLRSTAPRLAPVAIDGELPDAWPTPARNDVVFADAPIEWDRWVQTWTNGSAEHVPRQDDEYPCVLPAGTPAGAQSIGE